MQCLNTSNINNYLYVRWDMVYKGILEVMQHQFANKISIII